jgi:hypothetical protein
MNSPEAKNHRQRKAPNCDKNKSLSMQAQLTGSYDKHYVE